MWESSLGGVYTDKTWGDGKTGISSVEGFDKDAKFVCEKGMTGLVADEIGGIAVGRYYEKNRNWNLLGNVLSCTGRDMAPDVSESDHFDDICHWGHLGGESPFH
jgi:hypothetical protein